MKNLFKKSLLVLIGVLITSLTTNVWASESLGRVDMVYDFNGTEHTYAYYGSDNKLSNPRLNLGDLTTGTFTIKKLYWHCYDNWTTQSIDAFGWYNIGNGDTKIGEFLGYTGSNSDTDDKTDHEIKNEGVSRLIATANTGNSGTFTFSHWFIANFNYSGGQTPTYCSNGGDNYNFTFNILPPNATAITATASGCISGSGTEDDPYIIRAGGDFTVSLSGSEKGRDDDNSDVQYSVDGGSTWGTTSTYTSKAFSNVTATSLQNYVFKARCYNSTASLASPTVTTKTVYYKTAPWSIAGSMNNWSTTANPIAHYSSGTGYAEMTLEANTAYTFKLKDRTKDSDDWFGFDTPLTYSDNGSSKTFETSHGDCTINTAGKGTYRFTWSGSAHTLTVTYPTSYTVTFGYGEHGSSVTASGSGSGSITSGQYVKSGENVEFSESHDTGYSLKGWYTTADGNTAVSTMSSGDNILNGISGDKTVYAQYDEIMRTVTVAYKYSGSPIHANGSVANVGVATSQSVTALDIEGYTFSTWSTMPSGVSTSSSLTSSTITINASAASQTITANYTLNSHTLTWNLDGGSITSEEGDYTAAGSVNYGTALTAPNVKKDNYTFAGWSPSVASTMPDADASYTATWTENTFEVTFADDGHGSANQSGTQDIGIVTGVAISATPDPGYEFDEWVSSNGGTFTSSVNTASNTFKPTANTTLTAKFKPATYNGTLNGVDGSNGTYSVVYGETSLTVTSAPALSGYHPQGYYLYYDGTLKNYSNPIAYASETTSKELVKEAPAGLKTYTDEDGKWIYTEDAPTIYIQWAPNTYDITLTANLPGDATGNTGTAKITATMNSAVFTPNSSGRTMPHENGYTFLGYYTDEDEGDDVQILDNEGANVTKTKYINADAEWVWPYNITVYGLWSPKTYTVTLNNEGADSGKEGTTGITATFDATTNLTSAITKPQKSGYTFGGYYTGQGGTGSKVIDENGAWIKDVDGYTGHSSTNPTWKYYDADELDLYAKWTQTISFDQNDATVDGSTNLAATYNGALSTGGITNPNKIGYAFAGWATAADGDVVIEPNGTVNDVADWTEDGKWIHAGESELVATWTADVNNFKADAATTAWGTADNWSQNKVPTEYTEVHIKGNATVSSHVYVGKVVIEEGTLTIASTGALEVAGTITNTDEDKLVVNSRGALIFDNSAGSTYATVELSTTYASAGSHFQFIGLPVWGVSVSTAFAGKGVYTYAWKQGEGWERRGYYDDLMAFEAIALMGSSGYTFHGALVPTTDKEYSLSYAARENGDVYMYGNSWTAPIKVSGMTIDSYDGAHIYDGSTGSWDGAVSGDVIPAMQAFAVLAKSGTGGSVSIPYNTAVRNATSPNAPLRAPQRNTSDILDHISVYVTGNELQTRMRLFENEQFTNDIDNGYEAIHMEGEGRAGELYAQADDKMTVLATPNLEGTVVGFIPGEATNYTISFEGDGKGYYLNDVVTNQSTLIAEGNTYMFTPDESTNDTRFIISKTPIHNMPTGVDAINDGVKARKQMINGILYIIRDGRLYDATGALVK